jgi:FkbM family methyltransferase
MMISIQKMVFAVYGLIRTIVRATGLMGPVRRLVGPVAGRLLFKLSASGAELTQIQGHKMYLAPLGGYPPLDMVRDRYEPGTTRLFQDTVKPSMVVIDIGAHVGYFTLLAAKNTGTTGKVYSFEPEPNNHDLLTKNIEINEYQNIVATKMAVSDRTGSSELYLTALDSGRHSLFHHNLPEQGSAAVETTTLDFFLESQGWPQIDLIKIDVEGAEATVLDGMTRLLERSTGLKMIVEFNPALLQSAGVVPLQFLERLSSEGWGVNLIDEANGQTPLFPEEAPAIVDRLLTSGSSANLFCVQE